MYVGMTDRTVTVFCLQRSAHFLLSSLIVLLRYDCELHTAVRWLGQLHAGLSMWMTWFDPKPVQVESVVEMA